MRCAPTQRSLPPIWARSLSEYGAVSTSRNVPWARPMLTVAGLQAGYGPAQVLFDIGFAVGEGEVVTLLGRNGMGKTTTIRSIMGLLRAHGGAISFDGVSLIGLPPYRIAQAGLG